MNHVHGDHPTPRGRGKTLRIGVGAIMQESNTFNPVPTALDAFRADYLLFGNEVLERMHGARVELGGFLDVLSDANAETVPLIAAHACSGGVVEDITFAFLRDQLIERCAAAGHLDGLLLALHGAMATEGDPDAEGALLQSLRSRFPSLPIAASLDLHAHVTPRMVQNADLLVGYQTYPHVDMYETGHRVAELLIATMQGQIRPHMALAKRPMIVSPVNARTEVAPLDGVVRQARRMEADGRAIAASLFPVQPWLDVPGLGFAALVVTDGNGATAEALAQGLADETWRVRDGFDPDIVPLEDALNVAREPASWPCVIGDAGDAPSCGATGDNPAVVRALLSSELKNADRSVLVTLCDPDAVAAAYATGVGQDVVVEVGHALTRTSRERVRLEGVVAALGNGALELVGPGAHGMPVNFGPMAVVRSGALHVVLTSIPAMEWDPSPYLAVGLDPSASAVTFVKSPSHFRVAYLPIARTLLIADTPGASRCNMRRLQFEHVGYPLYPIEEGHVHAT